MLSDVQRRDVSQLRCVLHQQNTWQMTYNWRRCENRSKIVIYVSAYMVLRTSSISRVTLYHPYHDTGYRISLVLKMETSHSYQKSVNVYQITRNHGSGIRIQYSDWLRAGWSGDWIPGGGEIFLTPQDPASYTMGPGSFLGVKRPEPGVDRPPHLAPGIKKEYSHTSAPRLGLRGLF